MDLNFYPDLSDGTGQHVDSEFMDNSSYNGYDSVNKVSSALFNTQHSFALMHVMWYFNAWCLWSII